MQSSINRRVRLDARDAGGRARRGRLRSKAAEAGHRARRGDARQADRGDRFPRPTKTTSTTWTAACRSRAESQGPQHVDRLDRRQRSLLGRAVRQQPRHARFPEDALVASDAARTRRDNRWNYLGLVNEPCFRKPTGPDPNRYGLWLDIARPDCPPDPFENADEIPGRADRRARQDGAGRLLLRRATGIVGLRLFPNPDFDEDARKQVGCGALLPRSRLLRIAEPGEAVPRRHVVRRSATSARIR